MIFNMIEIYFPKPKKIPWRIIRSAKKTHLSVGENVHPYAPLTPQRRGFRLPPPVFSPLSSVWREQSDGACQAAWVWGLPSALTCPQRGALVLRLLTWFLVNPWASGQRRGRSLTTNKKLEMGFILSEIFGGNKEIFSPHSKHWTVLGNSLVVQWLGLLASASGVTGSIPGWGTKIPQAAWHGQKK